MSLRIEDLESALLNLPAAERARLADVLIASLEVGDDVAEAWLDEAERRAGRLDRGEARTLGWDEFLTAARSRLT